MMGFDSLFLVALGTVVAIANVVFTRRLWSSQMFDRSQKIAQTAMMWLVPGTFYVVRHLLREPLGIREQEGDSTLGRGEITDGDEPYVGHDHGHGHGHGESGGGGHE